MGIAWCPLLLLLLLPLSGSIPALTRARLKEEEEEEGRANSLRPCRGQKVHLYTVAGMPLREFSQKYLGGGGESVNSLLFASPPSPPHFIFLLYADASLSYFFIERIVSEI